ncbi:MAG TPA: hypothetical protein VJC05_03685 [Candidatus Andersenbacteria bacterium]|nr:hypothetical protein [Candidatus Andersenbacteria bacterium]
MLDCSVHSRANALEQATTTARTLFEGASRLGKRSLNQAPLLAWLPFLKLGADARQGKDSDVNACNPAICEILLFGSLATQTEDVGDVDLMVLDNGFYSMLFMDQCDRKKSLLPDSKDQGLQDNLGLLLEGYMGYDDDLINRLSPIPTDLHVLPHTVVTDEALRAEVARQHRDPQFFENAFKCMMRYDRTLREFVPTTLAELQERLRTKESD